MVVQRKKPRKEKKLNVFNEMKSGKAPEQQIQGLGVSWVQRALQLAGITDDIFVICDVVYSALRRDLTFAGRALPPAELVLPELRFPNQNFYWLQTPQTQYDPGPKSNWGSDKGYGWKDPNSHFFFAWQNVNPGKGGRRASVYYPWPGLGNVGPVAGLPPAAHDLDSKSPEYPNNMLYTNQRLVLSINCPLDDAWNYKKHDAVLLIHDPITQKMTYANKALASKDSKVYSNLAFLSFFKSPGFKP